MSIAVEKPVLGTTLLRVGGEVDMLTSPDLRQVITDGLRHGARRLVIDLDQVDFLGTSGLAVLVEARSTALANTIELWLVCSTRTVLRPLEIAGLVGLFHIADSVAAVPVLADQPLIDSPRNEANQV